MAKKDLFAIDIGSGKIRGAYVVVDELHNINIRSFADTSYAGFTDGEFIEPEALQSSFLKVINTLFENTGKKVKKLIVGIPSEFCGVIVKQIEKFWTKPTHITKETIQKILEDSKLDVHIENNKILHSDCICFLDESSKISASPIDKTEIMVRMNVSYVYAVEEFCNFIENCLNNCGINEIKFVSSPLAQAQTLFSQSDRDDGVLFMDNGFISSFVATVKGDGLTSLASFDLGGAHITALLMEHLNLPYKHAEELKQKIMLTVNPIELDYYESDSADSFLPISARQVNRYTKLKVQQIANLVKKCLDDVKFDWLENKTLYITGGGLASLKGSKEILGESLNRNIDSVASELLNLTNFEQSSLSSIIMWWFRQQWNTKSLWQKIFKK